MTIYGTNGPDKLSGTAGDDLIKGFAGNDYLNDYDGGDDILDGGDGDDNLSDLAGSNRLYGGAGNDDYYCSSDGPGLRQLLDGGAGNDHLQIFLDAGSFAALRGGDGNDFIEAGGFGAYSIDAGAGDDRVSLDEHGSRYIVRLGSGSDTIEFRENVLPRVVEADVIDFDTGPGGDRVDFIYYLDSLTSNWDGGTNPFATGHLLLVQRGSAAVLMVDLDGPGKPGAPVDWITFRNVDATQLTAENFDGYAPDGSAPIGQHIVGTAGGHTIFGTVGGDWIEGGDGNDSLIGLAGDDRLFGGDGNDSIGGNVGNDEGHGGAGDDWLYDDKGDSRYFGDDGNDTLTLLGNGSGARTLYAEGGTGADTITLTNNRSPDSISFAYGGSGDDRLTVSGSGRAHINSGSGNDSVTLGVNNGLVSLRLGTGQDVLLFLERHSAAPITTIVNIGDFAAGDGGDRLDLGGLLRDELVGWQSTQNPFAAGYLRLIDIGGVAVLQIDRDRGGHGYQFADLIHFQNDAAADFTPYNFGGFDPSPL